MELPGLTLSWASGLSDYLAQAIAGLRGDREALEQQIVDRAGWLAEACERRLG